MPEYVISKSLPLIACHTKTVLQKFVRLFPFIAASLLRFESDYRVYSLFEIFLRKSFLHSFFQKSCFIFGKYTETAISLNMAFRTAAFNS